MLKNAYLLAKIGADTVENEQHFAENLKTFRDVTAVTRRAPRDGEANFGDGEKENGVPLFAHSPLGRFWSTCECETRVI